MEIHNTTEDVVWSVIDEICRDEEQNHSYNYCTSRACRVDAACYVLNRVPPRYVSSGRGLAHFESRFAEDPQLHVDIYTLAHEALRRVTKVQRSYYHTEDAGDVRISSGPVFCFPTLKGRIFHALTFEPMRDIDITLLENGEPVQMVDPRWSNPYHVVGHTNGTYLFRPAPRKAEESGQTAIFEFELRAEAAGFEPFRHFFELELTADNSAESVIGDRDKHELPHLYMLPQ
jgi:competence protein ComFB